VRDLTNRIFPQSRGAIKFQFEDVGMLTMIDMSIVNTGESCRLSMNQSSGRKQKKADAVFDENENWQHSLRAHL
jgi:hypothetical protein